MLLKKWKRKLDFADHMVTLELIRIYFFEKKIIMFTQIIIIKVHNISPMTRDKT